MAGSKLECDHVQPSEGCTTKETAESFLWHCGGGTGEDWVLACKPCHEIKTLSDKLGISFAEAIIEKQVLAITKQSAKLIDTFLAENGEVSYAKNPASRRDTVRRVLLSQVKQIEEKIK